MHPIDTKYSSSLATISTTPLSSEAEGTLRKEITQPLELSHILYDTITASITNHCDRKTLQNVLLVSKLFHTMFRKHGWNPTQDEACSCIEKDPTIYRHFSSELRTNPTVISRAVSKIPSLIFELPEHIECTSELSPLMNSIKKMAYLSAKLKGQRDLCSKLLSDEPGDEKCLTAFAKKATVIQSEWFHKEGWFETNPPQCFEDRELAWSVIHLYPTNILRLLESLKPLREDREIIRAALSQAGNILGLVSKEFQNNKELVLAAVSNNGMALGWASIELRSDREVVMKAVSCDPRSFFGFSTNRTSLSFAGTPFKNHKEVVLAAVRRNGYAILEASALLQADEEVILAAVTQNGMVLQQLDKKLQNNKKTVLAAVSQNGIALLFASDLLKKDREIVLAAVTQNGHALQYAHPSLQDDKVVVITAVTKDPILLPRSLSISSFPRKGKPRERSTMYEPTLKFASTRLRNDKDVALAASRHNGCSLDAVSSRLQHDLEIITASLEQNASALEMIGEALFTDKELVRALVPRWGQALEYASLEAQNDKEIVLLAVSQNGFILPYAGKELQDDPEILFAAAAQCEQHLRGCVYTRHFSPLYGLGDHKKFIIQLVTINGLTLAHANKPLRKDKQVVLLAVTQNGLALEHAGKWMKNDLEVVLTAMKQNVNAFQFASHAVQESILQSYSNSL